MPRKSSSSVQLVKPCSGAIACAVSPASVTDRCAMVRRARPTARAARSPAPRRSSSARRRARPCRRRAGGRAAAGRCAATGRRPRRRTRTFVVVVASSGGAQPIARDAPAMNVVELAGREQRRARGGRSLRPAPPDRSTATPTRPITSRVRARIARTGVLERVARARDRGCRRAATARARTPADRPARWWCPRTRARRSASALPASSVSHAARGTRRASAAWRSSMIRSIAPCAFARMTSGGVSSVSPGCNRGQRRATRRFRPAGERHHRHALDVERRQHARHIGRERPLVNDHQHPLGAEAARVREREIGDPVQADGGLAAARRPCIAIRPDDRLRDQLELARIDQRGDRGQVAIGPARAGVVEAERPRVAGGAAAAAAPVSAPRRAGTTTTRAAVARDLQAGLSRRHLAPFAGANVAREGALRGGDPAQVGVDDRDRAAREQSRLRRACRPAAPRTGRPPRSDKKAAKRARCASRRSARRRPARRSCARRSGRRGACRSLPGAGGRNRAICDRPGGFRPCLVAETAPRSGASARAASPGPRVWLPRGRRAARSSRRRHRPGCAPCAALRRPACAARPRGGAAPRGRLAACLAWPRRPPPRRGLPAEESEVGCCTRPVSIVAPAVAVTPRARSPATALFTSGRDAWAGGPGYLGRRRRRVASSTVTAAIPASQGRETPPRATAQAACPACSSAISMNWGWDFRCPRDRSRRGGS